MRIETPHYIEYAIEKLGGRGYEAYIVGGCVRDSLLGLTPKDWDIATSAAPDEVMSVFCDHKLLTHGSKYGTVAVILDDKSVEITTYRTDGAYSDNRRPDNVVFTKSLRDDLSRRDFTINALAYRRDAGLIDYFGGRADLENGVIRCVGNARERFAEDALRILRALRMASRLSFSIDGDTAFAARDLRKSLANIARERICAELSGILVGSGAGAAEILNDFYDVITVFIPELETTAACMPRIARSIACSPPDLTLRLALLLRATGACAAGSALRRLRFGNVIIDNALDLIKHEGAPVNGSAAIKRLLNKLGEDQINRFFDMRRSIIESGECGEAEKPRLLRGANDAAERANAIIACGECYSLKDLAVNGDDLLELGFKPGKPLGRAIDSLLEAVIEGRRPNEKPALLDMARGLNKPFFC